MYARAVLGTLVLSSAALFLLNVPIAGGVVAVLAGIVVVIMITEDLF